MLKFPILGHISNSRYASQLGVTLGESRLRTAAEMAALAATLLPNRPTAGSAMPAWLDDDTPAWLQGSQTPEWLANCTTAR